METHSSILAWKISGTQEPGGLQTMGSPRVRHDRETERAHTHKIQSLGLKFLPDAQKKIQEKCKIK